VEQHAERSPGTDRSRIGITVSAPTGFLRVGEPASIDPADSAGARSVQSAARDCPVPQRRVVLHERDVPPDAIHGCQVIATPFEKLNAAGVQYPADDECQSW
jgi:hypothetical protein